MEDDPETEFCATLATVHTKLIQLHTSSPAQQWLASQEARELMTTAQRQLNRLSRSSGLSSQRLSEHSEHLATVQEEFDLSMAQMDENSAMSAALVSDDPGERSSAALQRAIDLASETEEMGDDILGNLRQQRATLESARGHVNDMNAHSRKSSQIVRDMEFHEKCIVM